MGIKNVCFVYIQTCDQVPTLFTNWQWKIRQGRILKQCQGILVLYDNPCTHKPCRYIPKYKLKYIKYVFAEVVCRFQTRRASCGARRVQAPATAGCTMPSRWGFFSTSQLQVHSWVDSAQRLFITEWLRRVSFDKIYLFIFQEMKNATRNWKHDDWTYVVFYLLYSETGL